MTNSVVGFTIGRSRREFQASLFVTAAMFVVLLVLLLVLMFFFLLLLLGRHFLVMSERV